MSVTGILGKKIGMTQVFDEKGEVHPITVLQAGPCVITQLKTAAKDGYDAAQIGLVEFVKASKVTKPQAGHFAKNNVPPVKLVKEVPVELAKKAEDGEETSNGAVKAGDKVLVDIFSDEKYVDVIGTSKGRGFAGVVIGMHPIAVAFGSVKHDAVGGSDHRVTSAGGKRRDGGVVHVDVLAGNWKERADLLVHILCWFRVKMARTSATSTPRQLVSTGR